MQQPGSLWRFSPVSLRARFDPYAQKRTNLRDPAFNLKVPLRNRAAQAQAINDQLTLRQLELGVQRLENQVRVDVQNAVIGVQNARAQFRAATKARILQESTLDAEQKKYAAGASVIYNVILTQRDL